MRNFIEVNRTEEILFLEVGLGADEKYCFIEAKELLKKFNEVRFTFNGRKICLNKENFQTTADAEGLKV